jgi:hypothetical protein
MNISSTWHSDITRLPRTAVDLARMIKAAQPAMGKDRSIRQASSDRFNAASDAMALTYASEGKKVVLQKKLTGALVNIRV